MSTSKPLAGTFDISKVDFYYGPVLVSGFSEGDDAITVQYKSDIYQDMIGCDGEVLRAANNDDRAVITINLMPTAKCIPLLDALSLVDKGTAKAAAPLIILDRNSGTKYTGQAWIQKRPDRSFGQKPSKVTYVIAVAALIGINTNIVATPIG